METAEVQSKVKWIIDPIHSEIAFKVRHLMITTVKGTFEDYDATIETPGEDFTKAKIEFWMDPASVSTGDETRDNHIRSADFFDVEHHPKITFYNAEIESVDNDGSYELYGDLTIKGITKRITLDVEFGGVIKDPWGNTKAGCTINGKINRQDWNLNWNTPLEAGGILLGNDVRISCEIQVIKQR